MDVDVEAMLDAPFQEKPESEKREESKRSSSRHRHDRDGRDEERRSRHSSSSRHRRSSRSPRRRSRSRSRRSRSPSRYSSRRYRSRSPSYGRRRRSRSRERRRRSRSPRRRRDDSREARSPSPPVPEEVRDRRTIFVMQLAARLTSRELEDFFSQAGRVRDARIISDRNSRRSKGVGYVEFYEEESVQNALGLSGQKLLGIPVLVQMSEAEKNRLALQNQNNAGATQEPTFQRLYVGSIHFSLTEEDLRQIFEPFGPLDFVNLHKDPETGRSKGYAFIQYTRAADGRQALDKMNGFDLAGRNLKVGLVTDKPGTQVNHTNLDDDDSAGLAMDSLSRTELMHKLAARQPEAPSEAQKTEHETVASTIPAPPSRTIMMNNMFNPAEETEPDWVEDLQADVKQECMQFGEVEHILVNANSLGEVYLKFNTVEAGQKALTSLNGRWFGGKQITAVFVPEAIYDAKFSL
ncbi:hypothetical protein BDA99DRAFT_439455 [Phascolomyces articulosus]|uniref:RRM domain-containing protein n=1 Tax=Phascolomyces articulosus TaxID=60185 RepID=A0AAD5JYF2_9FUNG|nr:hypothetical protein BDA99DRAFT_439455 [Phascolomyces articulosus]